MFLKRSTAKPPSSTEGRASVQILARAVQVWRVHGFKTLAIKILAETIYRRVVLIERRLDEPDLSAVSTVPVVISMLSADDVDDYRAFRAETPTAEIRRRLGRGDVCFVARHEGDIVSAAWMAVGQAWVEYLACEIRLAPDEAYLYESFTAAAFRGHNIPAVRAGHEGRYFRDAGYRRLIAVIVPENQPALRHAEKAGWRVLGMMGYLKVGARRRNFCRVERHARPPGCVGPGGVA